MQEDDGFRALERRKELRKVIEGSKSVLEGEAREALLGTGIRVG
jgi:hypothetical protein